MQSSSNVAHVLRSSRAEQKVEVVIEEQDGAECVALRYSTWVEGLGWCGQKTIRVDQEQLEDLHRAITIARHRLGRRRAETGQTTEPAQVIQLPNIA